MVSRLGLMLSLQCPRMKSKRMNPNLGLLCANATGTYACHILVPQNEIPASDGMQRNIAQKACGINCLGRRTRKTTARDKTTQRNTKVQPSTWHGDSRNRFKLQVQRMRSSQYAIFHFRQIRTPRNHTNRLTIPSSSARYYFSFYHWAILHLVLRHCTESIHPIRATSPRNKLNPRRSQVITFWTGNLLRLKSRRLRTREL